MKNTVNQEDLNHVFETNPKIDHVFVTEDDHIFIPDSLGFCKAHCTRVNIKYEKVMRPGVEENIEEIDFNDEKPLEELSLAELKLIAQKFDTRFSTTKKADAIAFINQAKGLVKNEIVEDSNEELNPVENPVDATENTEE